MMQCRLILGLLVLNVVLGSPSRYTRQVELDNYDMDLEQVDSENTDIEYYDELATDEPKIEIGTLSPDEDNDPTPRASLEEENEEEKHKENGEKELRLVGIDTLHISGDSLGSGYMLNSGFSGGSGASGTSGEIIGSGISGIGSGDFSSIGSADLSSGTSGDIVSEVSVDLGSEVSVDLVSGVSGAFFPTVSSDNVSVAYGDFVLGESGYLVSEASGDFASGETLSGASGETLSGASGDTDFGVSGNFTSMEEFSGVSGNISFGTSADLGSGPSGFNDEIITVIPDRVEEFLLTTTISPNEAFVVSGEPVESGAHEESEVPLGSGTPVESGHPEETEVSGETIIPDLVTVEDLFLTTQTPSQEGTGVTTESGEPDSDLDNDIEIDITGLPICLLCTCLGGSVYCDDLKLKHVPSLPKDTTHFYARYNKITKINKWDFTNMNKLKRIDLTSNAISKIDDGALFGLHALEELVVRENHIAQLPAMPFTMTLIDGSHNRLGIHTGIHSEAFKEMTHLHYLYLTDNNIDHVPVPLPESLRSLHLQNNNIQMIHDDTFCNLKDKSYIRKELEDIRLDGNPINLSRTPQAYVCLPRIPVGALI